MRLKKAFNTDLIFPVVITKVPPNTEPSSDPFLREQIFIALANYLASRAASELYSHAQEATEGDGPSAPEATGK